MNNFLLKEKFMKQLRDFLCLATLFLGTLTILPAQSYKVLVADIPTTDPMINMIQAMADDMKVKVEINKVPMARMIQMIIQKQADIGTPILLRKDPDQIKKMPYDYSTDAYQKNSFVLYTNKSKPVDIADLKSGNSKGFKIESDLDVTDSSMYGFTTLSSTNIEGSLRKVDLARIDGYIRGGQVADQVLKPLKLTNVKRQLFDYYSIGFILQKGAKGGPVDKFLSDGLKKIKDTGKFDKIMGMNVKMGIYDDWQP
jgi:polar amino acid transport system substrate-binding protein